MSDQAVIVSIARTPIGKAHRGAFNATHGVEMAGHAARHAVERSGVDPEMIEDSIWGCGYPQGATGRNIARQAVIRAGLPVTIAGTTVNRFCASGLQTVAMGGHMILQEGSKAILVGGVESISRVQPPPDEAPNDWIMEHRPAGVPVMPQGHKAERRDHVVERPNGRPGKAFVPLLHPRSGER